MERLYLSGWIDRAISSEAQDSSARVTRENSDGLHRMRSQVQKENWIEDL
jgi:hypothetical protein